MPQVSIKTREGFVFKGVVRPPNEIVSMEGGDFFGDFVEHVPLDSNPVKTSACGGYGVNIVGKIFPKVEWIYKTRPTVQQSLELYFRVTQQLIPQSGMEES